MLPRYERSVSDPGSVVSLQISPITVSSVSSTEIVSISVSSYGSNESLNFQQQQPQPTDVNNNQPCSPNQKDQNPLISLLRSFCRAKISPSPQNRCNFTDRCTPCSKALQLQMAASRQKGRGGRGDDKQVFNTLWAPGEMESYVKLAISCYNDNGPDKTIDPNTFDANKINSSIMCTLVSFLLKQLDDNFNTEPQMSTLPVFEQLRLTDGPLVFDSTVDHIFTEASKYFNADDDVLHMGMFLCPEQNVKRAKHVIAWLAAYILFLDNFGETFQQPYEEMSQENQKKAELHSEIEDIKNTIATRIVEAQERENSLPQIESDLKEAEEQLQAAQSNLYKLEGIAHKEKANYDAKAQEARVLEEKLKELDLEKIALEGQIVHSAADVLQAHGTEKKKLDDASTCRDELGKELKELRLKQQKTLHLMERMKFALENFETILGSVHVAEEALTAVNKASNEWQIKFKENDDLKRQVRRIQQEEEKMKNELDLRNSQASTNLNALMDAIRRTEEEREDVNFHNLEIRGEIQEWENQIVEAQKSISTIVAKIHKCSEFFENVQRHYEIPQDLESALEMFGISFEGLDD